MDTKNDVCDNEKRCKVSLHNIVDEVKKDWKQFEDALKYAQVYKKIVNNLLRKSSVFQLVLDPTKLQIDFWDEDFHIGVCR